MFANPVLSSLFSSLFSSLSSLSLSLSSSSLGPPLSSHRGRNYHSGDCLLTSIISLITFLSLDITLFIHAAVWISCAAKDWSLRPCDQHYMGNLSLIKVVLLIEVLSTLISQSSFHYLKTTTLKYSIWCNN